MNKTVNKKANAGIALLFTLSLALTGAITTDLFAATVNKHNQAMLAEDNNIFAFELYAKLSKEEGNLFFSPFSISTALAMTYAGAKGDTAAQMANALHFNLPQELLYPAFSQLLRRLIDKPRGTDYQLSVANALWGQSGYAFRKEFIDLTVNYYDAGFKEVDFIDEQERELTRRKINFWVEGQTNAKIKDLIQEGVLSALTRLVLTNAIYFKGDWLSQFNPEQTQSSPFILEGGEEVEVPMMAQTTEFNYSETQTLQILEMPYSGNALSMIIVLPKQANGLEGAENLLTAKNLKEWLSRLGKQKVIVSVPRFKMSTEFLLNEHLESLGMADAFDAKLANFSGISPEPAGLCISCVLHKAFVEVNEEGTEAAAATGVVMGLTAAPQSKPVFRADHPFIFIIRDITSGSVLFLGRIIDPR